MYMDWPDVGSPAVFVDDTSVYPFMGRADDFVATAGKANEVCLRGSWIDTSLSGGRRDCACTDDSGDPEYPSVVTDQFTVKIWTNSDPPLRKPDLLVGETTATMVGRRRELEGTGFDIWGGTCSGDLIVDFTDMPEIVDAFTGAAYSPSCAP